MPVDAIQSPEAIATFNELSPLLILAIVLIGGSFGGWLAIRLHVPAITGNIVVGTLLGLTLFRNVEVARILQPTSTFAISLIAITAGGHFSYRRIHNALRRILFITGFEVAFAVSFVFFLLKALGAPWEMAMLLGCLAAGTAPGTTVALIRESRAKGPFVKTLLASVSMDSSLCILLFAFAHSLLAGYFEHGNVGWGLWAGLTQTTWQLLGSGLLGVALGVVTSRLFTNARFHNFSTMVIAVLVAAGLSMYLDFSPLLTCLFYGAYLGNSSPEIERQLDALRPVEALLYTCFFTLAGVSVHIELLGEAGFMCAAYLLARGFGKGLGAAVGAKLARCSDRITRSIPFGFVPQAGVALGLVVILQGDSRIPTEFSSLVGTLVLAAVTVSEIVGPFFTRAALRRAKEAGLDRPRLIEFLQEEFILTDLEAKDKWEALEKLADFYAQVHRVRPAQHKAMLNSIIEREKDTSTAIGRGAAIPHAKVDTGTAIQGVLGICPEGVEFGAPDGEPVKLIVMIVTPQDHEQRHLEVLASLMTMISHEDVRTRLVVAPDANHAWEVLQGEESRTYNYFLETDDTVQNGETL